MTMDEYKITQKSDFGAPQPPAAVCKALYDAADRVKKLAPWKLFCEVDICEIYLKDQEEPFYCSIQGMFEDLERISVYRGIEGLISLSGYINGSELPEYAALSRKNCLECMWLGRNDLRRHDLNCVRLAEKKYRGHDAWPLFRCYETGYEPYYLDPSQMELMAEVMNQLCNAMDELQSSGELPDMNEGERIRRMYDEQEDIWVNEILAPIEKIEAVTDGCVITDELLVRRLQKKNVNGCSLEFDMPFLPVPVQEDGYRGRRRYPKLCILCDADRACVENQYFVSPGEDPRDVALGMLVGYIEEKGRPQTVYVRDPGILGIIGNLCSQVKIEICFSPILKMLDFFVEDIMLQLEGE